MTYANAVLAACPVRRRPALAEGSVSWKWRKPSFAFLDRATTAERCLLADRERRLVSAREDKALYDQQPVEAATMAEAALAAFALLGDDKVPGDLSPGSRLVSRPNSLQQPLVDVRAAPAVDGLHPSGVNRNQGAESTLAYLWTELQQLGSRDGSRTHARRGSGCQRVASRELIKNALSARNVGMLARIENAQCCIPSCSIAIRPTRS